MSKVRRINDYVHMYMSEVTSRLVAASGRASDRFHLGKIILQSLRDAPDFVLQIDGATGESETFSSVLERSVRCAICFRTLGIGQGDVIAIMAPNHLHVAVPFYAALYLGVIVSAVDRTLAVVELQGTFSVSQPKVIFCQSDKAPEVQIALNEIDLDAKIVTFDGGDYLCSFQEFMENYGDGTSSEEFVPEDFDPEETIGFLIATSGTTGLPKLAAATHKNFAVSTPYLWCRYDEFPTPIRMALIGSPLQWLTAIMNFIMSPIFRYTRLQSSMPLTKDHCFYLLNTYQPSWTLFSPTFMTSLIKSEDRDLCDFSCLESILLGGSAVSADLIEEIKQVTPTTEAYNVLGMSELTGVCFINHDPSKAWACGQPIGCLKYRLINTEGEDIYEPNVPGELWLKGPSIFKCYYNNPESTEDTFAEDRWYKTGDMLYRDESHTYYFVERIKLLLKYKSYQVSPVELEALICQHPGVLDAAVSGLPDAECGELPVACVVRRSGCDVSAQEIKDLVKDTLSDAKQLRGGVIFLDQIPMTASTKVNRRKLREIVLNMERE